MSHPEPSRPSICLNMIVRNEAHIVRETLDSVAPYISSWVIVDTGSDDGTQDLIRNHMASLGIPGVLYERPWLDFGYNRTEALTLAQGRADYIWVIDADDIIVGTPDFTQLSADVYLLRRRQDSVVYWRPELIRDGVPVRWVGVTHEYATWDSKYTKSHLEGSYHIEDRKLSARNISGQKLVNDRDLLLAEVERNPGDARSVFYLAQTYFHLNDFANARQWYARRAEMGGWDEEVYYALYRLAESMANLDVPWPDVEKAYLKAWEFRPTRAEPLHAIARRHRGDKNYQAGYSFAERAARIPLPEQDTLFVWSDVYSWRIVDELAVCAFWLGKHDEAFALNRRVLSRPDVPDDARQRVAKNRDYSVPAMLESAAAYPAAVADGLSAGPADSEVSVSLIAGDREAVEQTLNSFLNCCTDVSRVGRFLVVDAGLSAEDRVQLGQRYGFIEFIDTDPDVEPRLQLGRIRSQVGGRFWLHLDQGWRFFAPEALITRLTAVLQAEPQVFQVGINFVDATQLTGTCAFERVVRRTPDAGRYVIAEGLATGPAMFDTDRLDRAGGLQDGDADAPTELGRRAKAVGLQTATLDEVLCVAAADRQQRAQQETRYSPAWYQLQVGGSVSSATVIVPMLAALNHPRSVLDVGCGVGGWVAAWLDTGVDAIGVDGDYVSREQLRIPVDRFVSHDLSTPLDLGRRFDLVTCLEVAEHLPAEAAETIVASLCRHADLIVFSAAVPGQGGNGHINEQWPSYWAEMFAARGYRPYDLLRSRLWWDKRCEWWYRQNLLVFATDEVARQRGWSQTTAPLDVVHPTLFALLSRA